jgi:hypothetical protein
LFQSQSVTTCKTVGYLAFLGLHLHVFSGSAQDFSKNDSKVNSLPLRMTSDEKIGRMVQVDMDALQNNVGRLHFPPGTAKTQARA